MLTRVYSKVTGKGGSQGKDEQALHTSTGGKATSSRIQKLSSYGDSVHAATAWTEAELRDDGGGGGPPRDDADGVDVGHSLVIEDGTPDLHHGLRPRSTGSPEQPAPSGSSALRASYSQRQPATASASQSGRQAFPE